MSEFTVGLTVEGLRAAWKHWVGSERLPRKLAQFERLGWTSTERGRRSLDRVVRLTEAGRRAALGGRDPEARWKRLWDGRWRMVLFDLPETQRALRLKLRRKLRALRFGCLQRSVWVSPDPVDVVFDLLRQAGVEADSFLLMEGVPCGGESSQDIVSGAWDFDRINRGYAAYLDILESTPNPVAGRASWAKWFSAECRAWRRAVEGDPLLPETLLPRAYRGREAWNRRWGLYRKVMPVA